MRASALRIIDVGLHLAERPDDLAPYTDLPWRRAVAEPTPNPPWSLNGSLHPWLGDGRESTLPARTPCDLMAHMDATGITAGVVLPGPLLKLGALPTAAYAAALARAYNRWLDAEWLGRDGRIAGAIIAAPQDPEDAAREIARAAGHPWVAGILLPMGGVDPLWGDRRYDAVYAAATDAHLPVILHAGGDLLLPGSPNRGTQFASVFEQQAMSHPLAAMATLVSMTSTGVFARFPDLRVLFLEAGMSWFTHIALRMDKEYNENRRDIPYYTDRVSAYLRRQVWIGTYPLEAATRPADVRDILRLSGGSAHLVFASHWPLPDHDAVARVAAAFPDAAVCAGVMGGNAATLFGITPTGIARSGAITSRHEA
ncbi:MAG: amidohydrolase [Thermomicrobia bacterium]|nr:amidohydrolase [Thermomicrobia bacterium]